MSACSSVQAWRKYQASPSRLVFLVRCVENPRQLITFKEGLDAQRIEAAIHTDVGLLEESKL